MRFKTIKVNFLFILFCTSILEVSHAAPSRLECLDRLGSNATKTDLDACISGTSVSSSKSSSMDTNAEEASCAEIGFKRKTPAFANCVLELVERKEQRLAASQPSDPDDATCRRYGFKPKSNEYASCRLQIDQARQDAQRQQSQFAEQQRQYEEQVAEQKRQKRIAASMALMQMGAGISSGAYNANNAYGALPTPPNPNRTYILPGGKMMNCTTTGTVTSCF